MSGVEIEHSRPDVAGRHTFARTDCTAITVHDHAPGLPDSRNQGFADWQFDIIDTTAGLVRLADDWCALFERAGGPQHVFQSYGFAALWAEIFLGDTPAEPPKGGCRLAIVTARRAGRLVLVWPLVAQRQLGRRVLSWLGAPIAQYGDVLLDPAEPALPLLRAAYGHVRTVLAPDILRLRKVRQDASIAAFLADIGTTSSEHAEAPLVTLAAGGSPFEDRQGGKARKNRRRLMRRLEESGRVAWVDATGTPAAIALVEAAVTCKRDWLARHGLLSAALADPRFEQFMKAAAGTNDRDTGFAVFALRLDDRPIAVALGFTCRQRLMLHLITQCEDVERFGAGVLNLEAILRQAEAAGLQAVDLLPPKADYKLDWADGCVAVADHVHGLTAGGRITTHLLDAILRPQTKRMLERLPMSLRRRLAVGTIRTASPARPDAGRVQQP